MNFLAGCAQLLEDPREVFTSANSTAMRCMISLPPVSETKRNNNRTQHLWQNNAERFARLIQRQCTFICTIPR
jgi:hypothetical protein